MDLEILRRIKWTTDYCIRFRICYLEVDTELHTISKTQTMQNPVWFIWRYQNVGHDNSITSLEFTRELILFSSGIWYMWHYVVISISEHVFHHPIEPKAICNVFLYMIHSCFHLMKESTRAFSSWSNFVNLYLSKLVYIQNGDERTERLRLMMKKYVIYYFAMQVKELYF